jgi:hypothetical protein
MDFSFDSDTTTADGGHAHEWADAGTHTDPGNGRVGAEGADGLMPAPPPGGHYADSDGDGVDDRYVVDRDHDGNPEQVWTDSDGSWAANRGGPEFDTVVYDTDDNGTPDRFVRDYDGDGRVDHLAVDRNLDGRYDQVLLDTNYDGVLDYEAVDTDFDGTVDVINRDTDNDGDFDTTNPQ